MVNFGSIPNVIGLTGRRPGAGESRVLQGRDVRSVHVLVSDLRGLDQNVHDVAIVDMPESSPESSLSQQELSLPHQQWPPAVHRHMVWLQQDLEVMRAEAKKRFRQTRPSSCVYYGTWIKCDMYRHVAKFHLDLAQLWRCPVSWCTVWKGTPQECMDHVRGRMTFLGLLSQPVSSSSPVDSSASGVVVGFIEAESLWNFDGRPSLQ